MILIIIPWKESDYKLFFPLIGVELQADMVDSWRKSAAIVNNTFKLICQAHNTLKGLLMHTQ